MSSWGGCVPRAGESGLRWGRREGDRLAARPLCCEESDWPNVSWSGEPGWGELLGRDGAASGARVGRRWPRRTHRTGMRGARCPGAQGAGARRRRGER